MSAHFIEEKVEDAFQSALLTENGGTLTGVDISGGTFDGFKIFKGFSLQDIEPPFIAVICAQSGPEDKPAAEFTGNQACTLTIGVYGHKGDTTRAAHAAIVGAVRDFMYASNAVALLNAAGVTEFTVLYVRPLQATREVQFGMLKTTQQLRILCRPS